MTKWGILGSIVAGAIVLLVMHLLYVLVLLDAKKYELLLEGAKFADSHGDVSEIAHSGSGSCTF